MRLPRAALAFLLVLAFPLASAGTRENPEVRDSADDTGAPSQLGADILAVWIHDETPTSLKVSLEAAEIRDPELSVYSVGFQHEVVYGYNQLYKQWTLTAQWANGETQYDLVSKSSSGGPVTGEMTPGAPGRITWTIPYTSIQARSGSVLSNFQVASQFDRVEPFTSARDDAASNARYQLGLADYIIPFVAPTTPPLFYLGNMSTLAAHDVQGLWIESGSQTVDFVLSTATLDPVDFPTCEVHLSASVSSPNWEWGSVSWWLEAKFGLNRTGGIEYVRSNASGHEPPPGGSGRTIDTYYPVEVNFAKPGSIRMQLPVALWNASYDPLSLNVQTSGSGQGCGGNEPYDYYYYDPYNDDFMPGPGVVAALATLAFVALRRLRPQG